MLKKRHLRKAKSQTPIMKSTLETFKSALISNNTQQVKHILKNEVLKFDINQLIKDRSLRSLHIAIKNGSLEQVNLLLQYEADISLRSADGDTCLHLAAGCGNVDIVHLFLSESDINAVNYLNHTPLFFAVKANSVEIADVLLNNKANCSVADVHGNTPLHEAVRLNSAAPMTSLLLKAGADPNLKNKAGNSAFHDSFQLNNGQLTHCFLEHRANVEETNYLGRNALHLAVIYCIDNFALIQQLLQWGMNVNQATNLRETPAHLAVQFFVNSWHDNGVVESYDKLMYALSLLVQRGADVNALDLYSKRPLDYAIRLKCLRVFEYLLMANATFEHDEKRVTIDEAMKYRDLDAIKTLLNYIKKNCCVVPRRSARCAESCSLLYVVVRYFKDPNLRREIVRLLLDSKAYGANHMDYGCTIIHTVMVSNDDGLLNMVIDYGADVRSMNSRNEQPIASGVIYNADRTVNVLFDNGIGLYDADAWGAIAISANVQMLKVFEARGAIFDPTSTLGLAVFVEAIKRAEPSMVKYALNKGADVNREFDNRLPLEYLYWANNEYHQYQFRDRPSTVNALIVHIALLSERNLHVHEKNMQVIESTQETMDYYKACCDELARMRNTKVIENFHLTYFDLVEKSPNSLVHNLNDKNFDFTLKTGQHKTSFVIYAEKIDFAYSQALEVQKVNKFEALLKIILPSATPESVIKRISKYYNDKDFAICLEEKAEM